MNIIKKLQLNTDEINQMYEDLDGYIWMAIDLKRGLLSAGDDYIADLRDQLLMKRSHVEDIYGAGLDLVTGEISLLSAINRRNPSLVNGEVAPDKIERLEDLLHYFFGNIPCFQAERAAPRYSKQPKGFISID